MKLHNKILKGNLNKANSSFSIHFYRWYHQAGWGSWKIRGTFRNLLPWSVGDCVQQWLDRVKHPSCVSTTWLQVIWSIFQSHLWFIISTLQYGFNYACMAYVLHGRVGETLLSEGLDMNPFPRFGVGSGPILLDNVICTGKEPSLLLCNRREGLCHDCTHHEDVNIACNSEHGADSPPASMTVSYLTLLHTVVFTHSSDIKMTGKVFFYTYDDDDQISLTRSETS